MYYKKCEICGVRSGRDSGEKRLFLAKFPLDEDRCKQWVKVTGKEDLVYVPIEKLHELKHICGKHFEKKDFNAKKTRLKASAVPSQQLKAEPLPDEMFEDFPCHIAQEPIQPSTWKLVQDDKTRSLHVPDQTQIHASPDSIIHDQAPLKKKHEDHTYGKVAFVEKLTTTETDAEYDENSVPELEGFSWEKPSAAVPVKADDEAEWEDVPDNISMYCDDGDTDAQTAEEYAKGVNERLHKGFRCNVCSGDIEGYRYTCVQCSDYDMCSACEASGAHDRHYVLRVPQPRPHSEVQSVLARIRKHLMKQSPIQDAHDDDDRISIKSEVKEEELEQDVLGGDNLEAPHDPVEEYFTELEHNPLEMTSETDANWSPHKFSYISKTMNISNTSSEQSNLSDDEAQSSDAADVTATSIQQGLSTTQNTMKRKLNIHQSDFNINTCNIITVSPDSNIYIPSSTAKRRIIIKNNDSMKSLINNILEKQTLPTPAKSSQREVTRLDFTDILKQMKCNVKMSRLPDYLQKPSEGNLNQRIS